MLGDWHEEDDEPEVDIPYKPIALWDARSGGPYLSTNTCDKINEACERFFKSRNMKTGKDYTKEINRI